MATYFNAASGMCEQISAGKLSIVEVLCEAIAQIENFGDTITPSLLEISSERSKRSRLLNAAERAKTVSSPLWVG
jgi:hypothetical protein